MLAAGRPLAQAGAMTRFLMPALVLCLPACATVPEVVPAAAELRAAPGWRGIATEDDARRLRNWRTAWTEALAAARAGGHAADLAREGALLLPDVALPAAGPPPGDYACRTIKIGARSEGLLNYVAYPAFRCRIDPDGETMRFTRMDGSQRPIGRLFAENGRRLIFLGTLQLGDETASLRYGRDRERDLAGIVERVGDARWRLVLPYPHFESLLDVVELIPR